MSLTIDDITEIESKIGLLLPDDVRKKYSETNGWLGPTNCQLLLTYGKDSDSDIVEFNNRLRNEDWWPDALEDLILIGTDGVGGSIGYDHKIKSGVLWYPVEGEKYELKANSVTEIWNAVIEMYESAS